jgi:hypothetical protein
VVLIVKKAQIRLVEDKERQDRALHLGPRPAETELITEASTIGLPPGAWPDQISVEGMLFQRKSTLLKPGSRGEIVSIREGGEIVCVRYTTRDNRFGLTVLND